MSISESHRATREKLILETMKEMGGTATSKELSKVLGVHSSTINSSMKTLLARDIVRTTGKSRNRSVVLELVDGVAAAKNVAMNSPQVNDIVVTQSPEVQQPPVPSVASAAPRQQGVYFNPPNIHSDDLHLAPIIDLFLNGDPEAFKLRSRRLLGSAFPAYKDVVETFGWRNPEGGDSVFQRDFAVVKDALTKKGFRVYVTPELVQVLGL